MYTITTDRSASTSGNCIEKDAKVEYEEVFDDRRAVQCGNSRLMRRRPERRAPAGNKYRAVEVSGGVEKERDYFGRRDDRYDDRRGYDRGYDRRGYDDRDRAFCGVPCAVALLIRSCAGVERYRPRDRYDDRRGRDDYDRRDRGRDDYDRRDDRR